MPHTMEEVFLNKVAANGGDCFEFDNEDDLVSAINDKCRMIGLGDETRFVIRDDQGAPRFLRRNDAQTELAQYQLVHEVEKGEGTKIVFRPGFDIWLKSADRTPKHERRIFNPNTDEVGPNDLNMWTGFAVDPAEGDWSLLRDHVRENICNGNEEHFRYFMGWMAQLFQEPGHKIGVAVVLRGKKGVGKSMLSDCIRRIIGPRHAMVADKKEQWTGRFTKQLEQRIFLACEEALFAGSHEQDSAMKNLITQEDFSYEAKGRDIDTGKNFTRVFVTSNEDWIVPATPGERRFFVLDVGDKHVKESKYFAAIDQQMREGGAAAMLHDLLKVDYSEIDLRNPPATDALSEQIEIGLKAPLAWLASVLSEGQFSFLSETHSAIDWVDEPTSEEDEKAHKAKRYVLKAEVFASYRDFVPGYRERPTTPAAVGKFLAKHVPGIEGVKKRVFGVLTPHYYLPWLTDARNGFQKANPGLTFAKPDKSEHDEAETASVMTESSSTVIDMQRRRRY
jgi:Family of unknown function (DUF5906)